MAGASQKSGHSKFVGLVFFLSFIIIIIVAVPRCAYSGGSLFLRGLALPPLPPPLTGACALVPRPLIGH